MADGPVLAFDTSGPFCTAAVLSGGTTLALTHEDLARGQAERLFPLLTETLHVAGLGWPDIAAIGVGVGPGNFTGIRISVAAARGLALSLGRPAVGVGALEALALDAVQPAVSVVAGRRDTVYAQVFDGRPQPPFMTDRGALRAHLPQGAVIVGEATDDLAAQLGATVAVPVHPRAVAIARLAAARAAHDTPRPKPLYLRPADAVPVMHGQARP